VTTREEILATGLPLDDHGALADALSVGRTKVVSSPIGIGTVLAAMAPYGGDFLNALEAKGATDANAKWALKMIEQATFDVGHPITRLQLEAFAAANADMADGITALLNVAIQADGITPAQVARILDGSE
jgi:hypothetical protein